MKILISLLAGLTCKVQDESPYLIYSYFPILTLIHQSWDKGNGYLHAWFWNVWQWSVTSGCSQMVFIIAIPCSAVKARALQIGGPGFKTCLWTALDTPKQPWKACFLGPTSPNLRFFLHKMGPLITPTSSSIQPCRIIIKLGDSVVPELEKWVSLSGSYLFSVCAHEMISFPNPLKGRKGGREKKLPALPCVQYLEEMSVPSLGEVSSPECQSCTQRESLDSCEKEA